MNGQNHSEDFTGEVKTDFGFTQVKESEKAKQVKGVFNQVAAKYDLMNDLLSLGLHRWWKKRTIDAAGVQPGMKILDIAGGTGDMTLGFANKLNNSGEIWLTDINAEMLKIGRKRLKNNKLDVPVAICDAEKLPFASDSFDIIIVAFGLRNMTHKDKALKEMLRVCKPGGKVMVLEFSKTAPWLSPLYDFYSFKFMPWLGQKIAGASADYRYLAESIRMHPDQRTLAELMKGVGFSSVKWNNFTFGITALHIGYK
jgi:demethylmenaquinone methyltransferase/2-methoxy-6-polyprenyl-1,4-benzoquinol methylase